MTQNKLSKNNPYANKDTLSSLLQKHILKGGTSSVRPLGYVVISAKHKDYLCIAENTPTGAARLGYSKLLDEAMVFATYDKAYVVAKDIVNGVKIGLLVDVGGKQLVVCVETCA